ncbi:MAG: hypothetical protein GY806_10575 [Gammaproteobacteria bacterium]|nr:hypothetical protein [Gammaproteobacteria bacterium]
MNNLAENLDPIFDSVEESYELLEAEIIEIEPPVYDSFPMNFLDELDGWVRHSLAMNGFSDY